MLSQIIFIGCILGIIISIYIGSFYEPKRHRSQRLTVEEESYRASPDNNRNYNCVPNPWMWIIASSVIPNTTPVNFPEHNPIEYNASRREIDRRILYQRRLELSGPQKEERTSKALVENWRKSIVGLVKLADKNLESAKGRLEAGDFKEAVQTASTSVENMARALIHCYGGKPNPTPGQEEALRMLSRRFKGYEKSEFEKAVDDIARIVYTEIGLKGLSTHNLRIQFLVEHKAKQTLESASKIVGLFKRIVTDHFAEELQELLPPYPLSKSSPKESI